MDNKLTKEEVQAIIKSQNEAKKPVQDIMKYMAENYKGRYNPMEVINLILMNKVRPMKNYTKFAVKLETKANDSSENTTREA